MSLLQNIMEKAIDELAERSVVSTILSEEQKVIEEKLKLYEKWFGDIVGERFKKKVEEILMLSQKT